MNQQGIPISIKKVSEEKFSITKLLIREPDKVRYISVQKSKKNCILCENLKE